MTTTDHIRYWLDTAAHDWGTVGTMQEINPRSALVFAHWTLEKLSKALWVREYSAPMPLTTDNVAELLATTSFGLTLVQTEFVERLKAFHDDVIESDPERPAPRLNAGETPQTLIAQANNLRQQLLGALLKEAV